MIFNAWKTVFVIALLLALVSCGKRPASLSPADKINTSIAQTVEAAQPAPGDLPTQGNLPAPSATAVVEPTQVPISLPTLAPYTATFIPSPTIDSCYQAKFITDVTIPDGTKILPGNTFTKTWRIQNVGTCSWDTDFAVVFDSGQSTGAPAATAFPAAVQQGGTIDVSVIITAPSDKGEYTWKFMLRSDTGRIFGFGTNSAYPMTAVIKVDSIAFFPLLPGSIDLIFPETVKYDFSSNYCSAKWMSIFGELSCPGGVSDSQGFVVRNDDPKLQDGKVYSGKAIETHPLFLDDGVIRGEYPAILIENGNRFRAIIGCGYNGTKCNVIMTVSYNDTGTWKQLGTWTVDYADDPVKIDIDLSFLAGKTVQFGFTVAANGTSAQDWAHWVYPRIIQ